jgi:hypothetical protein
MKFYDIWKNKRNQNVFVLFITVIIIVFAVAAIIVTTSVKAAELKNYKDAAADGLKVGYAEIYSETDADGAIGVIMDAAVKKINAAPSKNAVDLAVGEAEGWLRNEYRGAVIARLNALYPKENYTDGNYAEISGIIDGAKHGITNLISKEEIDAVIAAAKEALDSVEKIQTE